MNKKTLLPLTLLSFLISIVLTATPVTASHTAIAQNSSPMTITSAKWSVAPQSTAGGTATAPLSLGTVPTNGKLFFLKNLGTINNLSQVITPTPALTGARTIIIAYCLVSPGVYGAWTGAGPFTCATGVLTNICTVTRIVTTCPAAVPLVVGANVQLRARPSVSLAITIGVTLTNTANVRAPITVNS